MSTQDRKIVFEAKDPTLNVYLVDGTTGKGVEFNGHTLYMYHNFKTLKKLFRHYGLFRYGPDIKPKQIIRFNDEILLGDYDENSTLDKLQTKVFMRELYKTLGDKLGVSVAKFRKVLNGILYETFLKDVDRSIHVRKFAYSYFKKSIDPVKLSKVVKLLPLLQQLEKDGIYHLAPIVYRFGKSPEEVRNILGKGKWKSLCRNSFGRNRVIADYKFPIEQLSHLNYPTSVFKNANCFAENYLLWITKHCKGSWTKENLYNRWFTLIRDTRNLAQELNERFSLDWNEAKMRQKHDEYVLLRQLTVEKSSTEDFPHTEILRTLNLYSFEKDDLLATYINNKAMLENEGRIMHHCVGMYHSACNCGSYLVYSIFKEGNHHATLGIRVNTSIDINGNTVYSYHFEQCYGVCNSTVDNATLAFAHAIVFELNGREKIKQPQDELLTTY